MSNVWNYFTMTRMLLKSSGDIIGSWGSLVLDASDTQSRTMLINYATRAVNWLITTLQKYEATAIGDLIDMGAAKCRQLAFFKNGPG